jgi:hypothetical protein
MIILQWVLMPVGQNHFLKWWWTPSLLKDGVLMRDTWGKHPTTNTSQDNYFDDLVILPWVASAGQIAVWSAAAAAFSPLPKLDLAGDVIREAGPIEVRGKPGDTRFVQANVGGAWATNARRVTFTLEEV